MSYKCSTCNKDHDDLPDIGAAYPDPWLALPNAERAARSRVTADTCVIDG